MLMATAMPEFSEYPLGACALIVCDMQDRFLQIMPNGEAAAASTQFAIGAARLLGASIALTEQLPEKLGHSRAVLRETAGPDAAVFEKSAFSALAASGLRDFLREHQVEHLLLAGLETPVCVYQTVVQAVREEWPVTVLSDCLAERRGADASPVLREMGEMGAHILPSESVFYACLQDAEHPLFKAYTGLVKGRVDVSQS